MSYDNTDTGALFKNKNRTTDKHPEYKGTINVGGKDYDIAAWVRESKKDGSKFFSIKVSEPYQKSGGANTGYSGGDLDDSIPFAPEWR